jgi:hypothetical protein
MIRLSDIVGASGLSGYAVVALLIFILAFVLAMLALYAPSRRAEDERIANLPFDDGMPSDFRGTNR